jgi:glycosyltransferase involved in cell wall biosynthesis
MDSSTPAISILTPVWNGLPYIRECVESVFSQEFKDWEFIISDNGSTDGTRDYLDSLTDARVRIFKQEQNLGIQGNLNFLISKANAPVAYILCADDYFYEGGLGRAVAEWSTVSPDTAFIAFNWKDAINHSALAKFSYEVIPKKIEPRTSRFVFFLFGNVSGNLSNVSAKVSTLKASGGFNKQLRQTLDFELWSRIARDHPMVLSDTATAFVRVHENAATAYMNTKGQRFAEDLVIYEKLIEELLPYVDRGKLLTYVNIEIASFHLRDAIKAALHGRFARMANFMETKSSITWPKWKQLILCLPFALSESGRHKLLMKMSNDIMKLNQ